MEEYDLGVIYFYGEGVEQDYKRAFDSFKKGADAGDPDCIHMISVCYFWGYGIETDLEKAAFYNEKAAKLGIVPSMFDTGLNYERGYGVGQNMEKALYWLNKAAEEGHSDAYAELGDLYFCGALVEKDLEKAFHYYEQGSKIDGGFCKLQLADFYERGIIVEKDIKKATQLYQEAYDYIYEDAAVNDEFVAQLRMGNFYFSGIPLLNITPDYNQAVEWYMKAAKKGCDDAQNNLGNMYAFGLGMPQDFEKAFYWYSQAAERMNLMAVSNVANYYYLGRGVAQDYAQAARFHSKAAHLGHPNSQEVLGEMYMKGEGVVQNYKQAVYWFNESCNNGERSAYSQLGNCYRLGLGVEKDPAKAFELYRQGADMDDLESKVSLAHCLIEGWGTRVDTQRAKSILEALCNSEENYRENPVPAVTYHDAQERIYLEDPLDELYLEHYAKAYYLLAILKYADGDDDKKKGLAEAISLLRTADRLGYQDQEHPELTARKLLQKLEQEQEKWSGIRKSTIEIRDTDTNSDMGRYDLFVIHADGSESKLRFKTDRCKFAYMLALLFASNKDSIGGLMARYFDYARERLESLARVTGLYDETGPGQWIDKFIYKEVLDVDRDGSKHWSYEYPSGWYSNAIGQSTDFFGESCSDEEMESYRVRMTGGKNSIAFIPLDPEQIVIPDSLKKYTIGLPTKEFMLQYKYGKRRPIDYNKAKLLPNKREQWIDDANSLEE